MGNSLSDFFSDEEIITNLRQYYDENEMYSINFKAMLKNVEDYNDMYLLLQIKDKIFYINKINGDISERGEFI